MGVFLVYIIKSALCLGFFYIFNKLVLSGETFHGVNRALWLLVVGVSLILPFVEWGWFVAPTVAGTPIEFSSSLMTTPIDVQLPQQNEALYLTVKYILVTYIIGVVILGIRLLISYLDLASIILSKRDECESSALELLARCKSVVGLKKEVTLIIHDKKMSPFSWMNYIIISRADMIDDGKEIIIHELAHIKYRHSWDIVLIDMLVIFQWFNPVVWLYKQALLQTHEYMADKLVLDTGVNTKLYQLLLIKKTVDKCHCYSMTSSLNHSKLKNRIIMMMKQESSKWAVAKCLYVLPLACLSATLFASPRVANQFSEISSLATLSNYEALNVATEPEVTVNIIQGVTDTIYSKWSKDSSDTQTKLVIRGKEYADLLILVNGKEHKDLSGISPDDIESLSVLKDKAATDVYGEKGKKGVILITLKDGAKVDSNSEVVLPVKPAKDSSKSATVSDRVDTDDVVVVGHRSQDSTNELVYRVPKGGKKPLLIIDGKESVDMPNAEDVDSMSVLKDKAATDLYGAKGKNGVILITLKKAGK